MKRISVINRQTVSLAILATLSLVLLTIKPFSMTGLLVEPILLSFAGGLLVSVLLDLLKSPSASGLSQLFYIVFWILFCLIKEIQIQIQHEFVDYWIEYFYFDKILVIGSVWLGSTLYFTMKRIFSSNINHNEQKLFFKFSSSAFILFYFALLLYSFVLIRLQTSDYPIRLIPFVTIKSYIEHYAEDPYEALMNFLGNLFYFTPMGYIISVMLRKKSKAIKAVILFFFPLITFTALEFSQYFFRNGYCEFDDISLNSIGFWFGSILCPVSDFAAKKFSHGRFKYFWEVS